jgi:hypothetical protein
MRSSRGFVEDTNYVTSAECAPRLEDYPGAKPEMFVPASVVLFARDMRLI